MREKAERPAKRKLTRAERKQIEAVIRQAKGDGKNHTVQDSILFQNKIYIIDGKTYLNHINDEVHLYGLLHQLAFLAGRIKDEEDVFHTTWTSFFASTTRSMPPSTRRNMRRRKKFMKT